MSKKLFTPIHNSGILLVDNICFKKFIICLLREGVLVDMKLRCNLSTLMGTKRYSIQDVHEKTGLSRGTISSLYNDRASRIDFDTIAKLCKLFKCDVSELLILDMQDLINDVNVEGKNE